MSSKQFCLLLSSFSIVLLFLMLACQPNNVDSARPYKSRIKFCKFDMLLECLSEPLSYFTSQVNGSGIANSEAEMEQFCFNIHDYFPVCAKQWAQRCGSPMQVELLMRLFVKPFQASMNDFCNSKGPIRAEFLKYSNCLIYEVKLSDSYRKHCVRPLQASQEFIFEQASAKPVMPLLVKNFCCSYNQWEDCIKEHLVRKCGEPSAVVIPNLIHHGSMFLLKTFCPYTRYDPKNVDKCNPATFQPPADYKPKGLKSSSLVSYLFSYSCPNVGWGIDEKRDF